MTIWDGGAHQQPAATRALRRALAADEVSHAWLVSGPSSVGQQDLARALTMALNCDASDVPDEACGVCDRCARIRRGTHELLEVQQPAGAAYVVDDVREGWIRPASRSITDGHRRVMRIVAADRMNEAAQNAFLKILEEPPDSTLWLLEAADAAALLETVVSRCRRLDVLPWGHDAMRDEARELGIDDDHLEAFVRAALGAPDRLRALTDAEVVAAREHHLALLARLADDGPGAALPAAKELTAWARGRVGPVTEANAEELARLDDEFGGERGWPPGLRTAVRRRHDRREKQAEREALDHTLDDLAAYLRDLLVGHAGGGADLLINLDHEVALDRDRARLELSEVLAALDAVDRCRHALERNGNPQLQLERLLLTLGLLLYRHPGG